MFKSFVFAMLLVFSLALAAAEPVDVNSADAQTIAETLNGIGLSRAEAIVAYREAHGPFQDADELVNVKGIGLATVNKNRELIRTSGSK